MRSLPATMATESSARECTSSIPVSATDTLNRELSRSRIERTTDRFSFSEAHPGRERSHVCDATTTMTSPSRRQKLRRGQVELARVRATSSTEYASMTSPTLMSLKLAMPLLKMVTLILEMKSQKQWQGSCKDCLKKKLNYSTSNLKEKRNV